MRVVISGAGLGGLVLAQALGAHADVVVLERDRSPLETGGYRIALSPEAVAVLARHLPIGLLDAPRFPWPLCRVTALGDAVHAMPPTGGRSGSTAILDAGWLAECIVAHPDPDRAIAGEVGLRAARRARRPDRATR